MAFRNIQFTGIGRPVIKIAEIKNGVSGQTKFTDAEYERCYFVTAGDMLFSWSGQPETSIDVSWWHGPDGWLNQHIFKVQPNEDLCDRHFFYYLLKYLKPSFIAIASNKQTTGLGHVTTRDLQNIQVGIPPLPEQRAIAAILGALDDKIELNRQMNETLEAMARALFKSWFVDFETFRNQGMQDSPLGPIPRGWQCVVVSEAVDINPPRKLERRVNATYVEMSALPTASARILETIRRPFSGSGSRFTNGDILLARITPCLEHGKTAIVDFLQDGEIGWGSTEFIVLGPKSPLSMPFNYCLARHPDFRAHAIQAMTGTSGRQRVDPGCFDHYWLAVPPASVAEQFEHRVSPWFQKMKANDEQSVALGTIRDTLLPKLLSGEIRVKDAGRFTEEVT
jgi:type I restriction enzyme S subunit